MFILIYLTNSDLQYLIEMLSMTETLQCAFRNSFFYQKNHILNVPIMQYFGYPEPKFGFGYPRRLSGTRLPDIPDTALSINRIQYLGLNLPLEFALAPSALRIKDIALLLLYTYARMRISFATAQISFMMQS